MANNKRLIEKIIGPDGFRALSIYFICLGVLVVTVLIAKFLIIIMQA